MDFKVVIPVIISFAISVALAPFIIPFLRRLKVGQTERVDGVQSHLKKAGTPTMGGIIILISVIVTSLFYVKDYPAIIPVLFLTVAFGLIGFLDDYISVVKKQNLGLKAGQKSLAQLLVAVVYLAAQQIFAPTTSFWLPFIGDLDIGIFYYPLMLFIIVGTVNAVNLTDGIDGLDASVTMVAAMGFMVIASIAGFSQMNLLAAALAGGCLGFLVWNFHPAKVFMGDTGSLFLGGMVVALAFGLRRPLLLVFIGIVYVVETLSDIIQIGSVKLTGKRVFKMAPIHHHFEMSGWSEVKIVAVFSAVTAVGCLIAVLLVL